MTYALELKKCDQKLYKLYTAEYIFGAAQRLHYGIDW